MQVTLRPNANGNYTSGWRAEGGDYTAVDEAVADDDTTRLYTPTPDDLATFAVDNHTLAGDVKINSITVYARLKGLDPVSATTQIMIRTYGNDYFSSTKDSGGITSYRDESNTWTTNPFTGDDWRLEDIQSLEIGVKKINNAGERLTQMYLVVDYDDAPDTIYKFPIIGADNSAPASATSANYNFFVAGNQSSWTGADTNRKIVAPSSFLLKNLRVVIDTAPGASKSWEFEIFVNGVATGVKVTLSGASATSGQDTVNEYTVYAGDIITWKLTPSGTPTLFTNAYWSVEAWTAYNEQPVMFGESSSLDTSSSRYGTPWGFSVWNATEATVSAPSPIAGQIKNLRARMSGTPGAGNNYTFTIMKNTAAQSLSTVISDSESTDVDYDDSHAITIAAGDLISCRVTPNDLPTANNASVGFIFIPDTAGQAIILFANGSSPSTTAVRFEQLHGSGTNSWTSTESSRRMILPALSLKAIRAQIGASPGSGKSYEFVPRIGGADTALSALITDANTTAGDTDDISVAADSYLTLECTPSGSPTLITKVGVGLGVYITPEVATPASRRVFVIG